CGALLLCWPTRSSQYRPKPCEAPEAKGCVPIPRRSPVAPPSALRRDSRCQRSAASGRFFNVVDLVNVRTRDTCGMGGHTKIDSTVRYLGIEVDDALAIAEQANV